MRVAAATSSGKGAIALGMAALWAVGAWLSHPLGIWPAVGGTALLLGITAVFLQGPEIRAALGLDPRALSIGFAAGAFMAAATYLLFPPVTRAAPELLAGVVRLYVDFGHLGPAALFVALPIVVACEEIVWRGVIYGALVDRVPWPLAVIAGTALYAIAHAPIGSTALVLACLGAGICWNTLRYETGSLTAVFVAHMVWDAALLVFWPLVGTSIE
ncbi:MAG: type II CAAX endopeptidase family protein [Candidatus Binatia bacterium]|nr:type II CAAX endopeptidase family protein [Candidatus Binatia bacterium]